MSRARCRGSRGRQYTRGSSSGVRAARTRRRREHCAWPTLASDERRRDDDAAVDRLGGSTPLLRLFPTAAGSRLHRDPGSARRHSSARLLVGAHRTRRYPAHPDFHDPHRALHPGGLGGQARVDEAPNSPAPRPHVRTADAAGPRTGKGTPHPPASPRSRKHKGHDGNPACRFPLGRRPRVPHDPVGGSCRRRGRYAPCVR